MNEIVNVKINSGILDPVITQITQNDMLLVYYTE
jgi:hypothetical protein